MDDSRIRNYIEDFLRTFDDSRFPAAFLAEFEAEECLGHSEWNETLLVRNRATDAYAVAKCYDLQIVGGQNEGELLRRLKHPALPAFLKEYRSETMLCVVRAYVNGVTLAQAAAEKPFTKEQTIAIGLQMCDVLAYLHGQTPPIIHRDIKPENIIWKEDGAVVLIDFGISRVFDEAAKKDTRSLGTALFAPPEQYGFAQTDCRSDIYSLGMVLGFLLTRQTEPDAIRSGIDDRALSRIVEKCTAFAPKERYANVAQLRRALYAQLPGARTKRRVFFGILGAAILCGLAFAYSDLAKAESTRGLDGEPHIPAYGDGLPSQLTSADQPEEKQVSALGFREPLIEQAVRATLRKGQADSVTAEELKSVAGLYICADTVSPDQNGFYASVGEWYKSGSGVRGGITSLEDVRLLPNLRILCVAAQSIADISVLEALPLLEKIELKHNRISDIAVLPRLPALASVGLNDNPLKDASPLGRCANLRFLDLCDVQGYDPAFLGELGDFEVLDIANHTDSYRYLGSRRVRELKLGYSSFDSLDWLSDVTGLESLEVKHSMLKSLAGMEAHAELTYLNIAGCPIGDLTPVLALPALRTLVLSEDLRPAAEALGPVSFNITYE